MSADEPNGASRIVGLDILRGIAILGILFMNINDMGASLWASFDDPGHIGWTRPDRVAWFLREVFADGTARCMLEMLFGAGMVILTDRAIDASDRRAGMKGYYRRNLILLGFGLVHIGILLWPGDILHSYAIAALIVFWFRRLDAKWLLAIGLSVTVMQIGEDGYGYVAVRRAMTATAEAKAAQAAGTPLTAEQRTTLKAAQERHVERVKTKAATAQKIAAEDRARTGGFASWAGAQLDVTRHFVGTGLELLIIWEAAATMLIGAALYKWGIIQGARSRRFYVKLLLVGYGIGLGARTIGALADLHGGSGPTIMWPLYETARLATTLGHMALVYVLLGTVTGTRLLQPFVAAGRTALSIYIAQTLICLWVLYPPFMLGLYGTQGWVALMATALAINVALLAGANLWVRRFRIAPVEWAWRSLAEGRRLRFR